MSENQRERNVSIGKRAPVIAVMEQAKIQVSLAHTHEARLDEFGWPKEQTAHLSERTGVLGQLYSARSQTIDTSKEAAIEEQRQLDSTKIFITRIRIAAPLVLGKTPTPGVTPGAPHSAALSSATSGTSSASAPLSKSSMRRSNPASAVRALSPSSTRGKPPSKTPRPCRKPYAAPSPPAPSRSWS